MLSSATPTPAQNSDLQHYFYIDVLRVLAMCFVILLHCMSPYIASLEIYASRSWYGFIVLNSIVRSAVPIFFMISGFLILKSEKTLQIFPSYKSRLPKLLIPLLFWNVAYFLFAAIFGASLNPIYLLKSLINSGTGYHMWFIYTLIGLYILAPFLARIARSSTLGEVSLLFFIIISTTTIRPFINTVTPIYIYLFEPLANGYIGFFLLGYILAKADFSRRTCILFYLGGILGIAIGVFWHIKNSDATQISLVFNLGHALPHFLVSSAIFVAAKEAFKNARVKNLLCRAVSALSDISYGVFWIHVMVLFLCERFVSPEVSPMVLAALRFLLTLVISASVIFPLSKIRPVKNLLM